MVPHQTNCKPGIDSGLGWASASRYTAPPETPGSTDRLHVRKLAGALGSWRPPPFPRGSLWAPHDMVAARHIRGRM
ncbi:hypothetical protein FRAHR75_1730005 [Frankia sp. Hr75.2]|nr:hypothetical protein FRAHR75_1730005 [Frankia sp. Hr75.2]